MKDARTKATNTAIQLHLNEADRIAMLAEAGKKIAPTMPEWDAIKISASKMGESLAKLSDAAKALAEVEVQLKLASEEIERMRAAMKGNSAKILELQVIIDKQKKELDDFEAGIKKRQQTVWLIVTGFSAILLVIGIFLFIYADKKMGVGLITAALTLTCVSYFMAQYVAIVAMIGGGLLFLVIAGLIYMVIVNRKALFETVKTVEVLKPEGWKDGAHEELKAQVRSIQSPTTVSLVDEMRCQHDKEKGTCPECKANGKTA